MRNGDGIATVGDSKIAGLVPRKRALHRNAIRSLEELVAEAKAGGVTAVVTIATQPGMAYWIIRSNMTAKDRMSLLGQIEYLKWLLIHDEENE